MTLRCAYQPTHPIICFRRVACLIHHQVSDGEGTEMGSKRPFCLVRGHETQRWKQGLVGYSLFSEHPRLSAWVIFRLSAMALEAEFGQGCVKAH